MRNETAQSCKAAIERQGWFGELFLEYTGDPRGAMGRYCGPLEKEVLTMPVIQDVDGGRWIPVNADALHELVEQFKALTAQLAAWRATGMTPDEIIAAADRRHACKIDCLLAKYNDVVAQLAAVTAELSKYEQGVQKISQSMDELRTEANKMVSIDASLKAENAELHTRLAAVTAEKDAAVMDIPHRCYTCKFKPPKPGRCRKGCEVDGLTVHNAQLCEWEWRGPQEAGESGK